MFYDRIWYFVASFNPIQDGGEGVGKKPPSYQFFPYNFYKRKC